METGVDERAQTRIARREIFRPVWFMKLLRGQLSLGDTFWIGNYGVGLIVVPVSFVFQLFAVIVFSPQAGNGVLSAILAVMVVYLAFLTRAVWIAAKRTPSVGGWRWAGVVLTLLNTLSSALFFATLTLIP